MSGNRQRLGTSVHPHGKSGWLLVLSLSLHLAALALLLMRPLVPPPAGASDPMPVEFITEMGPDQAPSEASTTTAPAAPEVPAQPAEASQPPAPAPDVSPPVQQAEVPPAASIPIPDVVSTPQPAELPLSAQAPAPTASPLQPAELPTPPEPPPPKVSPYRPVPLARAPSSQPLPRPNRSPPQRVTNVRPAPTSGMTGTGEAPVTAPEGSNSAGSHQCSQQWRCLDGKAQTVVGPELLLPQGGLTDQRGWQRKGPHRHLRRWPGHLDRVGAKLRIKCTRCRGTGGVSQRTSAAATTGNAAATGRCRRDAALSTLRQRQVIDGRKR